MSIEAINKTLRDGRTLTIREAKPGDAAELLAYIEQLAGETQFLTMEPGEFSLTEEQEAHYLRQCADSPNQAYIVGCIDGVIVASASLGASNRVRIRHVCELGMSVKKDYWRLGIGRMLLNYLVAWARANPILVKMDLSVRADNDGAIALYRSFGFVEEGRHRRRMYAGGVYYDTIAMGLDVDA